MSKNLPETPQYAYDGNGEIFLVGTNHYRKLKKIWNNTKSLVEIDNYLKKYNLELQNENKQD